MSSADRSATPSTPAAGAAPPFWPTVLGYLVVRLLLTAVLAAAIWGAAALAGLQMPLLIAVLLGVILQLPMAWLLFGGMRERLSAALEARSGRRRQVRAELQAALDGSQPPVPDADSLEYEDSAVEHEPGSLEDEPGSLEDEPGSLEDEAGARDRNDQTA